MKKSRLSEQQQRRIRAHRARRGTDTSAPTTDGSSLLPPGALGPEQRGRVVASYGRHADVVGDGFQSTDVRRCHLRARLEPLATGDRVLWRDGNPSGVIVAVEPRSSLLERPDANGNRRPVAANIQRIAIVIAPVPTPSADLIDRYLVAAENQRIAPILIANKLDLSAHETQTALELLVPYGVLGYPVFAVSAHTGAGVDRLAVALAAQTSILVGQSGVGKSSLLNALQPTAEVTVGSLSATVAKGRHTTTHTRLFQLANDGYVIDSPGIREFGLWHLGAAEIERGFIEFAPFLGQCRFRDCRHAADPDCALRAASELGLISPRRLASYRLIIDSLCTR